MATKKKAAPKKVVRKTTKKAVQKAVTKRAYNRKPKPEVPALDVQASNVESNTKSDAEFIAGLTGEGQSNESVLRGIEVIDLRGLSIGDRFAILLMLDSEGYITFSTESLLQTNNLIAGLETESLVLQHANKLVRSATWEEVSHNSSRISRPSVNVTVGVGFSRPEPAYPETVEIGDAHYVRVA